MPELRETVNKKILAYIAQLWTNKIDHRAATRVGSTSLTYVKKYVEGLITNSISFYTEVRKAMTKRSAHTCAWNDMGKIWVDFKIDPAPENFCHD